MCQKLDHAKDFTVASNLLKEEERLKLLEDKLVKFLNQNSNNNEINLGNDNENCIASDNETNKEYLNMKENTIQFINSYITKSLMMKFLLVWLLITRVIFGMWNTKMDIKKIFMPLKFRGECNCIIH